MLVSNVNDHLVVSPQEASARMTRPMSSMSQSFDRITAPHFLDRRRAGTEASCGVPQPNFSQEPHHRDRRRVPEPHRQARRT
jgi:hypothetical protein